MKGWRVDAWCAPEAMAFGDLPEPEPGEGQALVAVDHAALNFFDILMIGGKYQVKPPLPFTPGCEIAGTVVKAGPGSRYAVGQRVCAQPDWGAFAERCLVDNLWSAPVPDGVPLREAACIPVVYPTAHVSLKRRGQLQPGEWVLATAGAGGVGLATIQMAKAWGARVVAAVGSADKRQVCLDNGAEAAVVYGDPSWIEEARTATGGHGFDVIVDPVGGEVYDTSLKAIAWEGRAVIVGFAGGSIQRIASNRLLLKNASAVGAIWGGYLRQDPALAREVMTDCFRLYEAGAIRPVISAAFPLAEVPAALNALGSRGTVGKVVIEVGG